MVLIVAVSEAAVVGHGLAAAREQPVDAEARLGVDQALAIGVRHARDVRRGSGPPRAPIVVVPVMHQVARLVLQVTAGVVVVHVVPCALHRGLDVLLRPWGRLSVGQRRDPLVRVAERVAVALQRVVALQQALCVPVR